MTQGGLEVAFAYLAMKEQALPSLSEARKYTAAVSQDSEFNRMTYLLVKYTVSELCTGEP